MLIVRPLILPLPAQVLFLSSLIISVFLFPTPCTCTALARSAGSTLMLLLLLILSVNSWVSILFWTLLITPWLLSSSPGELGSFLPLFSDSFFIAFMLSCLLIPVSIFNCSPDTVPLLFVTNCCCSLGVACTFMFRLRLCFPLFNFSISSFSKLGSFTLPVLEGLSGPTVSSSSFSLSSFSLSSSSSSTSSIVEFMTSFLFKSKFNSIRGLLGLLQLSFSSFSQNSEYSSSASTLGSLSLSFSSLLAS
mmetsp:Transcript_9220/g.18679  ORF Transcript_9220/g.18679 Transcript_9220/m.18679 type:complete len:248 (+) Transcript_9220:345-1088(+)